MTATTVAPRTPTASRGGDSLANTWTMIRFILRRDRVRLPIWISAIVLFVVGSVASFPATYPTQQDLQARADLLDNPATVALTGPAFGTDHYTLGAMTANEMLGYTAIAMALMSIVLMTRHTRAEEETGRTELLRAGVLGRHAGIAAALIVVGMANLLIGALLGLLLPVGLDELPTDSSLLFGAAVASVGLVFTAIGALAVQVTEHARAASGIGAAALGVAFALRAAGDMGNEALSWLSPIGWAQRTKVYVDDRWWPLALSAGLAFIVMGAAFFLTSRRDVGAGLLRPRLGSARGSASLSSALGLATRLQRGGVIGWGIGLFLFGLAYGGLGSEVNDFVAESPSMRDFLATGEGASFVDAFYAMVMIMMALLTVGYVIQSMTRMRGEETAGRAEPVLATATGRVSFALSHTMVALTGGAILMVAGALGTGITAAISLEDGGLIPRLLGAAVAHLIGIWLVVGVAAALFGVAPRALPLTWVILTYAVIVSLMGNLLSVPDWMMELSPVDAASQLPGGDVDWAAMGIMAVLAVALFWLGMRGFRRRDLTTN